MLFKVRGNMILIDAAARKLYGFILNRAQFCLIRGKSLPPILLSHIISGGEPEGSII